MTEKAGGVPGLFCLEFLGATGRKLEEHGGNRPKDPGQDGCHLGGDRGRTVLHGRDLCGLDSAGSGQGRARNPVPSPERPQGNGWGPVIGGRAVLPGRETRFNGAWHRHDFPLDFLPWMAPGRFFCLELGFCASRNGRRNPSANSGHLQNEVRALRSATSALQNENVPPVHRRAARVKALPRAASWAALRENVVSTWSRYSMAAATAEVVTIRARDTDTMKARIAPLRGLGLEPPFPRQLGSGPAEGRSLAFLSWGPGMGASSPSLAASTEEQTLVDRVVI